jgi:hypothetical protein
MDTRAMHCLSGRHVPVVRLRYRIGQHVTWHTVMNAGLYVVDHIRFKYSECQLPTQLH